MASPIDSAKIYANFQGINKLKTAAKQHDKAAAKEVAQQFEALFLQTMLKNMRSANKTVGGDFLSSNQLDTYHDLYDKQLALTLSKSGVGLADAILKQIEYQQSLKIPAKSPDNKGAGVGESVSQPGISPVNKK